jgi:hypothetical protein
VKQCPDTFVLTAQSGLFDMTFQLDFVLHSQCLRQAVLHHLKA